MNNRVSKSYLDLVRRVGKEIACCLLPDEFPYFDIIWRAIGPMLKEPAFRSASKTDFLGRLENRLGGLAFAAGWSKDADLLTAPLIMVLRDSLDCAIAKGVCSDDEVGRIVAERSLRWPLPEKFLYMAQIFVSMICGAMAEPSTEVEKLISHAKSLLPHKSCYFIFHHGDYHYYPEELPAKVTGLRERARFWLNPGEDEFFSCGQEQERTYCPKGKHQKMLRFLCLKENADRKVPFNDLYKYTWKSPELSNKSLLLNSINGGQNALNNFAYKCFIVNKSTTCQKDKDEALVYRHHGDNIYEIDRNTHKECCIISKFTLPE